MYAYSEQIERQDGRDWTPAYNPEFVAKVHAKRREQQRKEREREIRERRARLDAAFERARAEARREKQKKIKQALQQAERAQARKDAARERLATLGKTSETTDLLRFAEMEIARYGMTINEFRSDRSRKADRIEIRRAVAVSIYVKFPKVSLPRIGKILGIDHSSVLNHVKKAGVWRNPGRPGTNHS